MVDQLTNRILSLFERGSRYQAEKIVTIAVYVVIVVGTFFWVFAGDDATNELGASWGYEKLEPLNENILFLENESSDDWTGVRVVLNRSYLFTVDRVAAGSRVGLRPEDFEYYYYIPRPWGREDWEMLARSEKPGQFADKHTPFELIQVRTDQGRLEIGADALQSE